MAASTLNIGITGLNAAQANLITTGQNIANASTPGYTRQQVVQEANLPMFTGAGFLGQGTNIDTVKRVYSGYLTNQVLTAQTGAAEMDRYEAQINQINNLVADVSSGLSPAMTGFFSTLDELAANPTSTASRQAFLSAAESMVARFQALDQRLNEIRTGSNSQIVSEVTLINSYAKEIAAINQRIVVAQSAGDGQPANDLLDQRDQLINELNKEIRVSAVPQSDGTYSIFIGSGQPLVTGNDASLLTAAPDMFDPLRTSVALTLPTGAAFNLPDEQLTGGSLGGLLAFRNNSLDPAQNALGRIAIAMAQTFNDQHKLGQDLVGELGGDFFKVPQPIAFAHTDNPPPAVTVSAAITDVSTLTTSDYQLTSNGGGNYTLLRLADNKVLVSNGALPASIDGIAITVSAAAPSGATFMIQPTRAGARDIAMALTDTRNIAVAAPIRTGASLSNTGTATISAGTVMDAAATPPSAAITLRYLTSPAPSLDGFPVGATVDNGSGQTYKITSPTMQVPYAIGANISFNGIAVQITGVPVNGDSYTINPQPGTTPTVTNTGFADMFGVPGAATIQGAAIGTAAPTLPVTIVAGVNDQFDIALDGGASLTKTLAPGVYPTALSLAGGVQTAIGGGATASVDASGALIVTSNLQGGATAVALSATGVNAGYLEMFGGASTPGNRAVVNGAQALSSPTNIVAGINDRFSINVDGAGAQTVLIPAGDYTPADLALQMQTSINALSAAPGVSVSLNGANQLVVMSNQVGGASAIALSSIASGTGVMAATAVVTQIDSLPAAPLTIQYDQATNSLRGFPVGASVSVAGDSASPYLITSTLDGVAYTPGATISFNGISLAIGGVPNDGDSFTVAPNSSGVSDNRNALLLGQLQTMRLLDGTTSTFQSAYSAMVNQVGNKTREVQVSGKAQHALADQAQTTRDSVSAVNLDEEAANLLRFQQAYQASAKLIAVAGKLFDALLEI